MCDKEESDRERVVELTPSNAMREVILRQHVDRDYAQFLTAKIALARHPELGERRAHGIREIMTDAHFRLIYEVTEDDVRILAIVHTGWLWPPAATSATP